MPTTKLPGSVAPKDVTTTAAPGSNTISKIQAYRPGSTVVFELTMSDNSVIYLKTQGGRVKIGGTDESMNTGTEVTWQS